MGIGTRKGAGHEDIEDSLVLTDHGLVTQTGEPVRSLVGPSGCRS